MQLAHFVRKIFKRGIFIKTKEQEEIGSIESFYKAIERERCRTDRTELPFALLSFEVKRDSSDGKYVDYMTKAICSRMRTTDQAGWIDSRHIGLLLYNTAWEGVHCFVEDIRKAGNDKIKIPDCGVYIYPPDRQDSDQGNGNHKGSQLKDGAVSKKNPGNNSELACKEADCLNSQSCPLTTGEFQATLEDTKDLFIRKIPLWKRFIDIFGSLAGLVIFFPLMLIIAIAIKLDSRGPIFFKQKRVGIGGKIFTFLKFRSMYHNCDQSVHIDHINKLSNGDIGLVKSSDSNFSTYKITNDERVTLTGRVLRKTSIDELPQLLNVLKGEMSLVGPRPYPVYQAEACDLWQRSRVYTIPGITGLGQLQARYDKSFTDSYRLDLQYMKQFSLWLDIKIIFKTVLLVFSNRGAQ